MENNDMVNTRKSLHAALEAVKRAAAGAWGEFRRYNGPQAAAAFAFFCFLSLLALLFFSGAVLGFVLKDRPELLERILSYISENTPGLTDTVSDALRASIDMRGILSAGGALGLLFTGTRVADSLQVWLCGMWGVEVPRFIRRKAKSLAILAFVAVTGLLGFGLHAAFLLAGRWQGWLNLFAGLFSFVLSTLIIFAALLFIYSYGVELKLGWGRAWKGALFTALLVNPVQLLLTWYYSNLGDFTAVYGSFAGVVLTIIIIYYAGYIVFLGAALNRFLAKGHEQHERRGG
ncbi:MAG: YihY/virulence factor BrkB family protein [Actinomycetota bacterium]|nr:YihY/virulence factor BrkB family protein [Actinomycetota bacterium]